MFLGLWGDENLIHDIYTIPQKKWHLHSSPKETFLRLPFLGEECRSVNFGPNIISTMLLVTIWQKPHSKTHRSHTVIRHLSTSHHSNFTKLDSSSKFVSCLAFWEKCISVNLGLYKISQVLLITICKRPHSKIPHGCLTILKCLSTSQLRKIIKSANKSSKLPRHGLTKLVPKSELFNIFKWGLLPIVKRNVLKKPMFHWHTLFTKRNAVFKWSNLTWMWAHLPIPWP